METIADKTSTVRHPPIVKRWGRCVKWVCGVLLLIATLLVWDGRTVAMIRFAGNVHKPGLDSDFKQLDELLPRPGAVLAEMYVGLPHPYFDKEEFVRELWSQPNRSIKEYRFERQPATPSEVVKSAFVEVLSARESFHAYQGPKLCGGYHADFAVKVESGGVATWFLVCLGCGEVLIYSKDKELICELEPVAETRLREAWSEHLGEPFKLVQTRLPVSPAGLEKWGLTEYSRSLSDRPPGKKPRVLPGNVRGQTVFCGGTETDAESPLVVFNLREESFRTEEEAAGRVEELKEPAESPATGRDGSIRIEEIFSVGTQVYAISAKTQDQADPSRSLIERIRRHFETTAPQELKQFE